MYVLTITANTSHEEEIMRTVLFRALTVSGILYLSKDQQMFSFLVPEEKQESATTIIRVMNEQFAINLDYQFQPAEPEGQIERKRELPRMNLSRGEDISFSTC